MKWSWTQTGGEQTVEWKLQLYEYKISTRRMLSESKVWRGTDTDVGAPTKLNSMFS